MPCARTIAPAPASTAQLDEADLAAGRKIACPTFVLWGSDYLGRGGANPLEVWRAWCTNVDGAAVKSGHFLAEENPKATLAALLPFLLPSGGRDARQPRKRRRIPGLMKRWASVNIVALGPGYSLIATCRDDSRERGHPMKPTGKALQVRKPTLPAVRPSIALALGGGGARGLAHILMLEVFDELGIAPKIIAGTSIGAVFGAAYASGLSARLIRAHTEEALSQRFDIVRQLLSARSEPVLKILNFLPIRSALLKPELLLELLLPSKVARDFADLADSAQGRGHRLLCPGAGRS